MKAIGIQIDEPQIYVRRFLRTSTIAYLKVNFNLSISTEFQPI